jgi:hypothetical protein
MSLERLIRPVVPMYGEIIERCARQRARMETMHSVIRLRLTIAGTMRKTAEAMRLHAALARRKSEASVPR